MVLDFIALCVSYPNDMAVKNKSYNDSANNNQLRPSLNAYGYKIHDVR